MGPSGAADFEAVPGREEYGAGEDGAAEWEKTMLEFAEDNFNDAGIELRSMDQRDLQVGLFGDFLDRVGHGSLWSGGPMRSLVGCTRKSYTLKWKERWEGRGIRERKVQKEQKSAFQPEKRARAHEKK